MSILTGATIGSMQSSTKLSVSIPTELAVFLETYMREHGLRTKSSVVEQALEALKLQELEREYAEAAADKEYLAEFALWDGTTGDGITPEDWE